MVFGLM